MVYGVIEETNTSNYRALFWAFPLHPRITKRKMKTSWTFSSTSNSSWSVLFFLTFCDDPSAMKPPYKITAENLARGARRAGWIRSYQLLLPSQLLLPPLLSSIVSYRWHFVSASETGKSSSPASYCICTQPCSLASAGSHSNPLGKAFLILYFCCCNFC